MQENKPIWKTTKKKLSELKLLENNPRTITTENYQKLKEDVEKVGNFKPLIVDVDGTILGGNQKYRVLVEKYGSDHEIEVSIPDRALTRRERNLTVVLDNNHRGEDDIDVLSSEYEEEMKELGLLEDDFESENEEEESERGELKVFDDDYLVETLLEELPYYKSGKELALDMINKYRIAYEFERLCNGYDDGYYISSYFNYHRFEISAHGPGAIESFNSEKIRKAYAKYIVKFRQNVGKENYVKYMAIGVAGNSMPNEFRPSLARDIYKKYTSVNDTVLDMCSGWGGRLLGAYSSNNSLTYIGTDPSVKTYNGLIALNEMLKNSNVKCNVIIHNKPFEELDLKDQMFDFAFTSPPYFDTEKYSDEKTQSFKKFDNYEKWKEGFLYPMIDNTLAHLRQGKVMLLNVGNNKYDIDRAIIDYVKAKKKTVRYIDEFKIGGSGLGDRTQSESGGEPFIEIVN